MVEKIFGYYGQDMVIDRAGERSPVRGFFQTITGKAQRMTRLQPGALGVVPAGSYVYFGPLEPELALEDTLEVGGKRYTVRRAEVISGVYVWGICVEKGCEDTWGSSG